LAREMGVDISTVKASGPNGRLTAEDIKEHAGKVTESQKQEQPSKEDANVDHEKRGPVSTEKIKTIRKITARNVTESWQNIPHVTHFDEADITKLEEFRGKFQEKANKDGVKITVTALLIKICGYALQKFP